MKLREITIKNFRGIDSLEKLSISEINTFVGKNDSGKSTILKALQCFFDEKIDTKDVFKGKPEDQKTLIELSFDPLVPIDDLALDVSGLMTITREFESANGKTKTTSYYKSSDYKTADYQDLWNKKEQDLNQIITTLGLTPEKSGRGKTNLIRIEQIKGALTSEEREERSHLLGEFLKNIEKEYSVSLPEYSLFDAEQNLDVGATNFQSQFKPIISDYFDGAKSVTDELEGKLKDNLATEFDEIRKFMVKNVPGLKKFNPTTEFNWTKSLAKFDLNLEFEGQNFDVPISHKGTGFKRLLMVAYFEYLASKKTTKNQIFAIEEPETYLHPLAQEDLLKSILDISQTSQFFLTTHSPIFAGATSGDNSILVTKDTTGVSKYEKGSEDIIQKIISELGIRPDYNLLKSKFFVFVEGRDDVHFLKIAAKTILNKDLDADGIAVLIGGGSSLVNYAELDLFKQVNGRSYAVLMDGDHGASDKVTKDKAKAKIKTRCDTDGAVFVELTKREIENYCHPTKIKEFYSNGGHDTQFDSTIITIENDTDVEKLLSDLGMNGFKNKKNIDTFKLMTTDEWKEVDPTDQIKNFIESVYSKISS